MNRPDGRRYEGEWKSGKQHGKGKITNAKGETKEYEWVEGRKVRNSANYIAKLVDNPVSVLKECSGEDRKLNTQGKGNEESAEQNDNIT